MLIFIKLFGAGLVVFTGAFIGLLRLQRERSILQCLFEYKSLLEYIQALVENKNYSPDEILYEIKQTRLYPHLRLEKEQHLRNYVLPGWLPADIQNLSKVFSQVGTLESEQLYKAFKIYFLLAEELQEKAQENLCKANCLYIQVGAMIGLAIVILLF